MAGKAERLKVEIKEDFAGDVRTFTLTLTAPSNDFLLTDLLKQRGVIEPLDAQLKQAVKGATEKYLASAENLVAGLAAKPNAVPKKRLTSNGNGKATEPSVQLEGSMSKSG